MPDPTVKQVQLDLDLLGFDPGGVDGRFGSKTAKAIDAFCAVAGIRSDGTITPELLKQLQVSRNIMLVNIPSPPHGVGELDDLFGGFGYRELSGGNIDIDDDWEAKNLVFVEDVCDTGLGIRLHRLVVDVFEQALTAAMAVCPKYKVRMLGGYCPRHMKSLVTNKQTPLSVHSWGAAFDINWDKNPFSKTLITDLPPEFVAEFTKRGWNWGGSWKSSKDAMHFQFCTGY